MLLLKVFNCCFQIGFERNAILFDRATQTRIRVVAHVKDDCLTLAAALKFTWRTFLLTMMTSSSNHGRCLFGFLLLATKTLTGDVLQNVLGHFLWRLHSLQQSPKFQSPRWHVVD